MSTVGVVIPTFKYADKIAGTIESVLRQTRPADEIIVVDDGSPDNTEEVVRRFPVRYVRHEPNGGPGAARNVGAMACRSEYIAFLDHDDEWVPEKLEHQLAAISRTDCVFSYTGYILLRSGETTTIIPAAPRDLMPLHRYRHCIGPTSTYMVKRDAFLKCGGFRESLRASCEDWELTVRLMRMGPFVLVPEPLTIYHGDSGQSWNYSQMLARELSIMDTLLGDLRGPRRFAAACKLRGFIYSRIAITAKLCNTSPVPYLLRSLASWPFPIGCLPRMPLLVKSILT